MAVISIHCYATVQKMNSAHQMKLKWHPHQKFAHDHISAANDRS